MAKYRKFIVALLAAAGVVGAELPPGAPSWLSSAFAIAGAIGVWAVRNQTPKTVAPTLFARQRVRDDPEQPSPPGRTRPRE